MARIIVGSYMVRYPLGGMMSWVLQYLVGFQRLGHEVFFVEKSGYPDSCYDPIADTMSDDAAYGARVVHKLLSRFGLGARWCYVDAGGTYHGLARTRIEAVFREADLFIDMGTHGDWLSEAADTGMRVLLDGEPGFTQMKMENRREAGGTLPEYDRYYTTGRNVGTSASTAPTAGEQWGWVFHPVDVDLFTPAPVRRDAAFTTVMNWQSYEPVRYRGADYGHKDVEFHKFIGLPAKSVAPLELAVSGKRIPRERIRENGWRLRDAHAVTISYDSFSRYIRDSRGEFGVCKSGFVVTRCGWFSDRSAAYLASGRPVVLQDTGFGSHLPCGEGLFAVRSAEEAAAAIDEIETRYEHHARRAREIAEEYLDARKVLGAFLEEIRV